MNKKEAEQLFEKYRNGELTEQERLDLHAWYLEHARQSNPLTDAEAYEQQMLALDEAFPFHSFKPVKQRLWLRRIPAAAIILLAIGAGIYFYPFRAAPPEAPQTAAKPASTGLTGNKAFLTLANGKRILLTDTVNGIIAVENGVGINKTDNGQLIYENDKNNPASASRPLAFNIMQTPNGGQYEVYLPDGTHVWLNAASTLKYPTSFAGSGDRKVELSGEAYFEVVKDNSKPFMVVTRNHTVKVLGTHFNVQAYPDEARASTTLLEGSVEIAANNSTQVLKPGQEANVDKDISICNVDTEETVAWKNGYFRFDDQRLETVMKHLARWYDVQVIYKDERLKNETYSAVSTRFAEVSALLKMLEQTGEAKFVVEGKNITIMRKTN